MKNDINNNKPQAKEREARTPEAEAFLVKVQSVHDMAAYRHEQAASRHSAMLKKDMAKYAIGQSRFTNNEYLESKASAGSSELAKHVSGVIAIIASRTPANTEHGFTCRITQKIMPYNSAYRSVSEYTLDVQSVEDGLAFEIKRDNYGQRYHLSNSGTLHQEGLPEEMSGLYEERLQTAPGAELESEALVQNLELFRNPAELYKTDHFFVIHPIESRSL